MFVQDICADRKPEAHALGLGRDEGVEEPGALLDRYARAVVGHLQDDAPVGGIPGADLDAALGVLVLERLERID